MLSRKWRSSQGRSASAVSTNSFFRGISGCILSQVAIPIQKRIGDGGLYSIVAGLLALSSAGILLLICESANGSLLCLRGSLIGREGQRVAPRHLPVAVDAQQAGRG